MSNEHKEPRPLWRDAAGVFTAFIVVVAFVAIGFIEVAMTWITGEPVSFSAWYQTAMVGVSATCLGYILGKKSGTRVHGFDRPLCGSCPIRDQIAAADNSN